MTLCIPNCWDKAEIMAKDMIELYPALNPEDHKSSFEQFLWGYLNVEQRQDLIAETVIPGNLSGIHHNLCKAVTNSNYWTDFVQWYDYLKNPQNYDDQAEIEGGAYKRGQ